MGIRKSGFPGSGFLRPFLFSTVRIASARFRMRATPPAFALKAKSWPLMQVSNFLNYTETLLCNIKIKTKWKKTNNRNRFKNHKEKKQKLTTIYLDLAVFSWLSRWFFQNCLLTLHSYFVMQCFLYYQSFFA